MVFNLIDKALQYGKEERQELLSLEAGIYEGLFPKARRDMLYRRVKQTLIKGCRRSVKQLSKGSDRSIAFSILMKATTDIFDYGYKTVLLDYYNGLLDDMIGTH